MFSENSVWSQPNALMQLTVEQMSSGNVYIQDYFSATEDIGQSFSKGQHTIQYYKFKSAHNILLR